MLPAGPFPMWIGGALLLPRRIVVILTPLPISSLHDNSANQFFGFSAHQSHNCFVASLAPSASAPSLAQAICGWTRPPRPQSVLAMTFSRPDHLGETQDSVRSIPRMRCHGLGPKSALVFRHACKLGAAGIV